MAIFVDPTVGIDQPAKMGRSEFQRIVRSYSAAGRIIYTRHTKNDHPERQITTTMIAACLAKGVVSSDPVVDAHGNWKADIERRGAGQELLVAAAIKWGNGVIIVTAHPLRRRRL